MPELIQRASVNWACGHGSHTAEYSVRNEQLWHQRSAEREFSRSRPLAQSLASCTDSLSVDRSAPKPLVIDTQFNPTRGCNKAGAGHRPWDLSEGVFSFSDTAAKIESEITTI